MNNFVLRVNRLQAAERRANFRDRELMYGTRNRQPYGHVSKPRKTRRQSFKRGWLWQLTVACMLVMFSAVFLMMSMTQY